MIKNAFFTSEQPKRYKLWSCQKMCDALHYLLDNIFIRFGSKLRFLDLNLSIRVCSNVDDFNNRNLFLTAKLLKQGYGYHKIRKAFSKFYHRHSELIVKYNIGLKTLQQKCISEPILYGDLVYKFRRIDGKPNFSDQLKR